MKHSILLKVKENLIYQFSPFEKPIAAVSTVEFNRMLPEWEQTTKNCLVKKEDVSALEEFTSSENITKGVDVPYQDMLIYKDGLTEYAKYNKGGENNVAEVLMPKTNMLSQVANQNQPVTVNAKKEHVFFIEVAIDDENGEPYVIFKNDAPPNSMESKIMKSFILKAKKDGIRIMQGEVDAIKIVLTKK